MKWLYYGLIGLMLLLGLAACGKPAEKKIVVKEVNIYANAEKLSPTTSAALPRVYVPNGLSNTVSVIDSTTYQVIDNFHTDKYPQHVVPAYDLKTLWVLNNSGNTAIPIDPLTGKPGEKVAIEDPYNLYYSMDGKYAIVVAETKRRLDFRDPQTMALIDVIPIECKGINHMDFTRDGKIALATCEFSGELVKIDMVNRRVLEYIKLGLDSPEKGCMPQDIRLSPDGKIFYVADLSRNGVFLVDAKTFAQIGFIPTGIGTHSIYPSRDGRFFYIGNRGCQSRGCQLPSYCPPHGDGSITVIDPIKQKIVGYWTIPGGGSPDMGNVSADGKELWLSGRYDSEVYVFNTATGKLIHRIPVGKGPHGLTVWPQPGRFSLGHTGNMR